LHDAYYAKQVEAIYQKQVEKLPEKTRITSCKPLVLLFLIFAKVKKTSFFCGKWKNEKRIKHVSEDN